MLQYLKIQNLALLESLVLEFDNGFTAVTGETGAGKSVLLGALNLLSGARSNKEMIRQGSDMLSIEASLFFTDAESSPTKSSITKSAKATSQLSSIDQVLESLGLPLCEEGNLVLFRSLDQAKMSRIRINGSLATLGQLRELGAAWIDFHGPGEPQKLFKEAHQLNFLDAHAKNADSLGKYRVLYDQWNNNLKTIESLKNTEQLSPDELEFIANEIQKIDQIDLSESAIDTLESNYLKITQAQQFRDIINNCEQLLSSESPILEQLNKLTLELNALSALDPSSSELLERANGLHIEADDLSREIAQLGGSFDFEPEAAELVIGQMNIFQELKRKYGGSHESILAKKTSLEQRIACQGNVHTEIERIEAITEKQTQELEVLAEVLYQSRLKASKSLTKQVTEKLGALGFKKARLEITIHQTERFTPTGKSACQFLFAPNVGNDLLELNKIASSGETARVMLALKAVLAESDATPLLVFDEVDANVGGEVGRTVGTEMARIAQSHQVFCVTHLPQVASLAHQHLLVEKSQDEVSTSISIAPIQGDNAMRLEEIARMLGDRNSASAQQHAKALLNV